MSLSKESQAREDICRVGKSLFDRGYVHATAGNISVRLEDGFLITPTDACMGFLDPARLTRLDSQARHISGEEPSKTIALHARIYAATAESNSFFNSPFLYISVMMSEPPTSSPLTYNWGKVGQFA